MRFQPVKCNMIQLTRKRTKRCRNVSNICTKAYRNFCFNRRNVYPCPQDVKETAYKGLVHPVLEYGSPVWDPPSAVLQEELESVQKHGARFVTGNYNYETGSMTGILGHPQEKEEKIDSAYNTKV